MKQLIKSNVLLIVLVSFAILGTLTAMITTSHSISDKKQIQAVNLPEQYKSLSHNSNKPDTVLAYYDNDTVYVEFKH